MECKFYDGGEDDIPWSSLPRSTEFICPDILRESLCRVGISLPDNATDEQLRQSRINMNKIVKAFEECNSHETVYQHFRNNPRPYPTPVDMHPISIQQNVIQGRHAETSLLMYDVKQCNCCGCVKPSHNDPGFPVTGVAPFDQLHFLNSWHPAYLCICSDFCHGSQFYAKARTSLIKHYSGNHGGRTPQECLGGNVSDAVICKRCYEEVTSLNKNGETCAFQACTILNFFMII
jgi:hypothetical protein